MIKKMILSICLCFSILFVAKAEGIAQAYPLIALMEEEDITQWIDMLKQSGSFSNMEIAMAQYAITNPEMDTAELSITTKAALGFLMFVVIDGKIARARKAKEEMNEHVGE